MSRNPIMVFAGEFWRGASGAGLAEGFRQHGYLVQEIECADFRIRRGGSLAMRLAARFDRAALRRRFTAHVLRVCRVLKPDVFLTIKGIDISLELLETLRSMGIRTAMYYPDFHFDHPGVDPDSFCGYDLFVTTKSFQLDYLTALPGMSRIAYIPHGFCPDVHRPVFDQMRDTDFRADVAHTGNPSAYKLAWVEAVATMPASVSVALVGNRWEGFVRDRRLTDCRVTGELLGIAYAQAIQTARINVAMHFGPVANGWQDLVSTRTFEIPACGGFMLHIDNAEAREFYEVGQEIDVFSSHEELRDKVRYYLARPELRMQMAERAHARCVPAYSYVTRAAEMSELLADCR